MGHETLSEEYYDEVCRVIGDAVVVLAENGYDTSRTTLVELLRKTHDTRSRGDRPEQKVLENAIRLIKHQAD